jgi:hypothetical protein
MIARVSREAGGAFLRTCYHWSSAVLGLKIAEVFRVF